MLRAVAEGQPISGRARVTIAKLERRGLIERVPGGFRLAGSSAEPVPEREPARRPARPLTLAEKQARARARAIGRSRA